LNIAVSATNDVLGFARCLSPVSVVVAPIECTFDARLMPSLLLKGRLRAAMLWLILLQTEELWLRADLSWVSLVKVRI